MWASISGIITSCMHPVRAARSASLPCQTNIINPVTWEPERICEKTGSDRLEAYDRLDGDDGSDLVVIQRSSPPSAPLFARPAFRTAFLPF